MRQHNELLVADDGATQLQISVQLRSLITLVDGQHCGKQPWAVLHERGEDELETGGVESGHSKQGLAVAAQLGRDLPNVDRRDAIEPDGQVRSRGLGGGPDQAEVSDDEDAALAIVPLRVLHGVDGVDLKLTLSELQRRGGLVELDLPILPDLLEEVLLLRGGGHRLLSALPRAAPPAGGGGQRGRDG
eukprot:CAMPEP_0176041048 /NCGR_PEP_ID=MMETSP0120_2-20121206/20359_1 /TAXON_ID=160619 /ORGANISM="Kryptoperidinium foliaceum, Strain CCMP 1326" /LENGTH=187 /DNA_ID=CAMNT_0017374451 /DNA_START=617 /DNA_END=1176 /DNA_ORIENTATION=-